MKLEPIGQVDNNDIRDMDLDPITVPVCGINRQERKGVCEEFNFRPTLPWGNTFALIEAAENGGLAMAGNTIKWLRSCLINDEERARLRDFLANPDIEIEQQTIEDVYEALAKVYADRPTLRRSSSGGGGDSTAPTSTAVSGAVVSG